MAIAIALFIAVGAVVAGGLLAARGVRPNVSEWAVGGRSFGSILFWFLLAGETFTTFALLGASQGVFTDGAPGFFVLGTVVLFAAVGYWITPRIWSAGKRNELLTVGDFFAKRFDAPWLGALLGLIGIVALLTYTRVQLTGLGLILQNLLGSGISSTVYIALGAVAVAGFLFLGGLRSAAFVAVVKDVLLIVVLLVVAFGAAHAAGLGSVGDVFAAVNHKYPSAAQLPGIHADSGMNLWWWISFLLLTPATFAMPHQFQVAFSAKDASTIRRNQVWQPLYSLFYVPLIFITYSALVVLPTLPTEQANQSLLIFVHRYFPAPVIGLLAGAAILVALVPTAVLLLTAATLFTRNVAGAITPRARESLTLSRISVLIFCTAAVLLSISSSERLLSLMGNMYSTISQLAPAVVLAFLWRRVSAVAIAAGALTGGLIVVVPSLNALALQTVPEGVVVGVPALIANLIVVALVALVTDAPPEAAVAVGMAERAQQPQPVVHVGVAAPGGVPTTEATAES